MAALSRTDPDIHVMRQTEFRIFQNQNFMEAYIGGPFKKTILGSPELGRNIKHYNIVTYVF